VESEQRAKAEAAANRAATEEAARNELKAKLKELTALEIATRKEKTQLVNERDVLKLQLLKASERTREAETKAELQRREAARDRQLREQEQVHKRLHKDLCCEFHK